MEGDEDEGGEVRRYSLVDWKCDGDIGDEEGGVGGGGDDDDDDDANVSNALEFDRDRWDRLIEPLVFVNSVSIESSMKLPLLAADDEPFKDER